jgi:hypothetical protein
MQGLLVPGLLVPIKASRGSGCFSVQLVLFFVKPEWGSTAFLSLADVFSPEVMLDGAALANLRLSADLRPFSPSSTLLFL